MSVSSWAIVVDIWLSTTAPRMNGPSATTTVGNTKHCLIDTTQTYQATPTGQSASSTFSPPSVDDWGDHAAVLILNKSNPVYVPAAIRWGSKMTKASAAGAAQQNTKVYESWSYTTPTFTSSSLSQAGLIGTGTATQLIFGQPYKCDIHWNTTDACNGIDRPWAINATDPYNLTFFHWLADQV